MSTETTVHRPAPLATNTDPGNLNIPTHVKQLRAKPVESGGRRHECHFHEKRHRLYHDSPTQTTLVS